MEEFELKGLVRCGPDPGLQVFEAVSSKRSTGLFAHVYRKQGFDDADSVLKAALRSNAVHVAFAPIPDSQDFSVSSFLLTDSESLEGRRYATALNAYEKKRTLKKAEGEVAVRTREGWSTELQRKVLIRSYGPIFQVDKANSVLEEALLSKSLQHPNNLNILDIAIKSTANRKGFKLYLVYDAPGITLSQNIDAMKPLAETEVLKLLSDSTCALMNAHSMSVPHAHIGPDAIFFDGKYMIGDFLLPRKRPSLLAENSVYFCPEISNGGLENLNWQAADVYSLGVTALAIMKGAPPVLSTADEMHLLESMRETIQPLSYSENLKKLLMLMTCFNPEHRCSLQRLIRKVKNLQSSTPFEFSDDLTFLSMEELLKAESTLKEEVTQQPTDIHLNLKLAFVCNALEQPSIAKEYAGKSVEKAILLYGEDHVEVAKSYYELSFILNELRDFENAKKFAEKSVRIREEKLGVFHLETACAYNILHEIYINLQAADEAELFGLKCVNVREVLFGNFHYSTAESYNNLMLLYESIGEDEESSQYAKKLLAIDQALPKSTNTVALWLNLVFHLLRSGQLDAAEDYALRCLDMLLTLRDERDRLARTIYKVMMKIYNAQGKFAEEEAAIRNFLRLKQETSKSYNDGAATFKLRLGDLCLVSKRFAEAGELFSEIVAVTPTDEAHLALLTEACKRLASVCCERDNIAGAIKALSQAVKAHEELRKDALELRATIAKLLLEANRASEADEAAALLLQAVVENTQAAAHCHYVLMNTREGESGLAHCAAFVTAREHLLESNDPELAKAYCHAAARLRAAGKLSEAEQFALKSVSIPQGEAEAVECESVLVSIYLAANRHSEAFPLVQSHLATLKRLFGYNETVCLLLKQLVAISLQLAKADLSVSYLKEQVEACKSVYGEQDLRYAVACIELGSVLVHTNSFSEAKELAEKSLPLLESQSPRLEQMITGAHRILSVCASHLGKPEEAERLAAKGLAAGKHSSQERADLLLNMSKILESSGKYREAEATALEAYNLLVAADGGQSPTLMPACAQLQSIYIHLARFPEAEKYGRKDLALSKARHGENHSSTLGSYLNLAGTYVHMGKLDEALMMLMKVLNEHSEENSNLMIPIHNTISQIHFRKGNLSEAETFALKALSAMGENFQDQETNALVRSNLGLIYQKMNKLQKAEECLRTCIDIFVSKFGEDSVHLATPYNNLALVYLKSQRCREAERWMQKCLAIQQRCLPEVHPNNSASYNILFRIYDQLGEVREAEPCLKKQLAIDKALYGEEGIELVNVYFEMGKFYLKLGRPQEAESPTLKCFNALKDHTKPGDNLMLILCDMLFKIYNQLGRPAEANKYAQRVFTAREKFLEKKGQDPEVATRMAVEMFKSSGRILEAAKHMQKYLDLRKQKVGEDSLEVAGIHLEISDLLMKENQLDEAEEHVKKCLATRIQHFGEYHPEVDHAYSRLYGIYLSTGKLMEAEQVGLKSFEIAKRNNGENNLLTAAASMHLGHVYDALQRYEEAAARYAHFLQVVSTSGIGTMDSSVAAVYSKLAEIYVHLKRFTEAESAGLTALEIERDCHGETHEFVATAYSNMAQIYLAAGKSEEAEASALKAVDVCLRSHGIKEHKVIHYYQVCIQILSQIGKLAEASEFAVKVLNVQRKLTDGNDDLLIASTYRTLALLHEEMKQYETAETYAKSLICSLKRLLSENHPHTANARVLLSEIYYAMKRPEDAVNLATQGLEALQPALGETHSCIVQVCKLLALAHREMGNQEKAEDFGRRAIAAAEGTLGFGPKDLEELKNQLQTFNLS